MNGWQTIWRTIWQCIWHKWASGRGRASPREFAIYFVFFIVFCSLWIGGIFLLMAWAGDVNLIDFTLGYVPYFLTSPLVAVAVRRLHDLSRSGWWVLVFLVPLLNIVALAILFQPGAPGANRFGPEPARIPW